MVRLEADPAPAGARNLADLTLSYTDASAQRPREEQAPVVVQVSEMFNYDPLDDVEVRRNATIVLSAEALIAIDQLFDQARYLEAWQLANRMEFELRWLAPIVGDPQLVQDADLFARYQVTLASALGYSPSPAEPTSVPYFGGQDQRWGSTSIPVFPPLPTLEVDR
jgi:hypothetical protein